MNCEIIDSLIHLLDAFLVKIPGKDLHGHVLLRVFIGCIKGFSSMTRMMNEAKRQLAHAYVIDCNK